MKAFLPMLLLLILLSAISCPTIAISASVPTVGERADARESFAAAETAYRNANPTLALSGFRSFVLRHHDSELTARAYTYLGRIFLQQQRYTDALLYLDRIPQTQRTAEVQLLTGYCLVKSGENAPGTSLLQQIAAQTFTPSDQQYLYQGLALGLQRQQAPLKALFFYQKALTAAPHQQDLLENAHQILLDNRESDLLNEASFLFSQSAIGQDARLQLARKALADRDQEKALTYLNQILNQPTPFPWRDEAAQLMDRFSQGNWLQRDTIGALLPLSGRYATFGTLVKRGIDLALKLHNAENKPLKVLYRDTEGDPTTAREAASELANEERVMAILGPLTGSASLAAAATAQENETPLLSLSQRSAIPGIGPYIFRNALTARMQVRALARYAIKQKGFHSFGILAPQNRQGQEMAELFTEEVLKLGGLVIDEQHYAEDANDFRPQILHLMGKSAKRTKTDYRPKSEKEQLDDLFVVDEPQYPPTTFDALFLPDYADRIAVIAPQLAFYGIENLPLLGINGWNSPELLRQAGRYLEGSVFVDGFFLQSPYPFVKEFIDLFVETYGDQPSILEAQAFDSANILFAQLDQGNSLDRKALLKGIRNIKNYPGVTGPTRFDFTGEADKELLQLQIKDGSIQQIN